MQIVIAWTIRHWALAAAAIIVACAVLGFFLAAPPPPREIRIATGTVADSAYSVFAEAYAARLQRTGFHVRRVPTQGSVENLAMLRAGQVDVALVQGGIADPQQDAGLESLGAAFVEPVWVFLRADRGLRRLADLRGRRVAIGPEGSGTRPLALALLAANDIGPAEFEALPLGGPEAGAALADGSADAAILVTARLRGTVARLVAAGPSITLLDFTERADAYEAALPYLTAVTLPQGALSIVEEQPPRPVSLLAAVASVVVSEDMHPQVVSLLVGIMQEVHKPRGIFATEGQYPNPLAQALPVNADAERYYTRGRTALQSWLPFWVAVTVERLFFILLPVVGIALPLIRFGPMLYRWRMEGRIWRHYDTLRRIEAEVEASREPAARSALGESLQALEERVSHLALPASYRRHVFALRRDIAYVRAKLEGDAAAPAARQREAA